LGPQTENTKPRTHLAARLAPLARVAGSPRVGLALLAALLVYLGVSSLRCAAEDIAPGAAGSPYAAWQLKALLAALVCNVVAATFVRLPAGAEALGAWGAHAGVVVLAAGAAWYAAKGVAGYAVAQRPAPGAPFAAVERFYLEDTLAAYVSVIDSDAPALAAQTPLPSMTRGRSAILDRPVESPRADVTAQIVDHAPAALIRFEWRDAGPADVPAVEVALDDGGRRPARVLCPTYAFAAEWDRGDYAVRYAPQTPATQPGKVALDTVFIHGRLGGQAAVIVCRPDGSTQRHAVGVGQRIDLTLGGRPVGLTVRRFLARAWRAGVAMRTQPAPRSAQAVKLDIAIGDWRGAQWIAFDPFIRTVRLDDADLQRLPLPDGRTLALHLAPQSRPLPHPFRPGGARWLTYPGSGICKDKVCSLSLLDPAGQDAGQVPCRLNRPADLGPVRLYQDQWRPEADAPDEMVFLVRTRPGIWAVWLGCTLICLSLPYAFYVKPLLRRRRRAAP